MRTINQFLLIPSTPHIVHEYIGSRVCNTKRGWISIYHSTYNVVIIRNKSCLKLREVMPGTYLPILEKPSWLQTTPASGEPNSSSHTVPHSPPIHTPTFPSLVTLPPPSRRTSPELQVPLQWVWVVDQYILLPMNTRYSSWELLVYMAVETRYCGGATLKKTWTLSYRT